MYTIVYSNKYEHFFFDRIQFRTMSYEGEKGVSSPKENDLDPRIQVCTYTDLALSDDLFHCFDFLADRIRKTEQCNR